MSIGIYNFINLVDNKAYIRQSICIEPRLKCHVAFLNKNNPKKLGKNNPSSKSVRCIETNIVYDTIGQAAEELGVSTSAVSQNCKGVSKTCKGLHFIFVGKN